MTCLYGRNKELGLLDTLLTRGNEAGTGLMIITGARGMGKTRILESSCRHSAKAGLEVVRLNGAGLSGISLRYFLDDLSDAPTLERFAHRWSDWVDFYHPGNSLEGPVVIAIDDIDWVRSVMSGARIFRIIGRRLRRPLVVLLSCSDDCTDPLQSDDEQVQQHGDQTLAVVRCRLLSLSHEAVGQIAAEVLGMPPGPAIMDICAYADGVPAQLFRILDGLVEAGVIEGQDGTARLAPQSVLPAKIRSLARSRLVGLSVGTRRMVDVASVMGESFNLEELSTALGQTPLSLLPAIREAQEAGVLVDGGSCATFKDTLVWQTVRENVPLPVRGALLRDVGHQLLVSGDQDTVGEEYLLRAAQSGDRRAATSLPEAVARRATTDPGGAADLAAEALRLSLLDEYEQFRLLQIRADGLAFRGLMTEAVSCLSDALKRPLKPDSVGALRTKLAFLHILSGDFQAATAEAQQLLDRPDRASREIALLVDYLAHRWGYADAGPQISGVATQENGFGGAADLRYLSSFRSWCDGRIEESLSLLGDHTETGLSSAGGSHAGAFLCHSIHIQCLVSLRQFAEAEVELRALVAEADERGSHGWHAVTESLRALLALERGDIGAAVTAATTGLELGEQYGTGTLALLAHAVLAIASLRRTQMQAAVRHAGILSDPLLAGRSSGVTQPTLWAVLMVTEAHEGPRAAVDLAERLLAEGITTYAMLLYAPYTAPWLVRTALAADRPELAARTVVAADSLADTNADWHVLSAAAEHARGLLEGDADALRVAADLHQDPWSRAWAEEDLGGMTEDRDTAIGHLETAAETYVRSRALRDAARVRHSLRERGVRRRHWNNVDRPSTGWMALTDTEQAIARLVAAGMTNRQTAQQMSLSPHTVNFHLRNIYRKLDISSRVKLAAIVNQ
ncbi:hypothetical protein FE633_03280 [Streptomyces montanus]|uniref:HTH luxR-type domain-containing protein n=1 Tax=Streptomyces montanus TaxID=2580423 RepID=A0A5R9FUC1_9ACTN|nr:hypothetical protein FE633_03280 [Streptomyces montanus]